MGRVNDILRAGQPGFAAQRRLDEGSSDRSQRDGSSEATLRAAPAAWTNR